MSIPYTTGTVTLTQGQKAVTGDGTAWQTALILGGVLYAAGFALPIQAVTSNTALIAAVEWPGASGEYDYAIVRDTDDARQQSANATVLTQLLAEVQAGTLFKYDVAATLVKKPIYDERPEGFAFLAVDQNPAQLFIKLSNASGDWSEPKRYAQGEAGPIATIQFAPVITATPGTPASATITGDGSIDDPYLITITIPAGLRGLNWLGAYDDAASYAVYDGVRDNGSVWIAKRSTVGNAPPVLPLVENDDWELFAPKGQDGTGIGDVVGPSSAPNGGFVVFNGTSGKLIKLATASAMKAALAILATDVAFDNTTANLPGDPTNVQGAIEALAGAGGKNDAVFALEIADLKGQRQGMNGGVADAFDDQLGVVYGSGGIDPATISILHLDGANSSTAIVDNAIAPKAWLALGNAQISTAQSKFGGAALLLDGAGDAVTTSFPADFAVGIGDWSVDFWFRPNALGSQQVLFESRSAAIPNNPVLFTSAANVVVLNTNGAIRITGATVIAVGTWYHVAVSRVSGVTRMFINGVQEGVSYTDPTNIAASAALYVGFAYDGSIGWNGYIDEFRLSKSGLYPANFVPPAAPYFVDPSGTVNASYDASNDYFTPALTGTGIDANTLLALHCDGANGAITFPDSSNFARAVTANGAAKVSTAQSVFGGASALFGALNDYLSVPDSPDLNFSSGNFTIDFRVRATSLNAVNTILSKETTNSANCYALIIDGDGTIRFVVYSGSSAIISLTSASGQVTVNNWYHIAVVRNGSVFNIYKDGVSIATATAATAIPSFAGPLRLGRGPSDSTYFITGYVDEFRVSNVARWTTNFTPPTNPYVAPVVYTADLTTSGQAISGGDDPSGGGSTFAKGKAFDGDLTPATGWASSQVGTGVSLQAYLGQDFGTPKAIRRINIVQNLASANSISSVLIRYSDNNSTYTTAVTLPLTFGSNVQSFDIPDVGAHRYWIMVANANPTVGSAVWGVTEVEMMEIASTNYSNMALVSIDYPTSNAPGSARVAIQLAGPIAFVPNTDFSMEVSRDGGTTWSTATLALTMNYNGIRVYEGAVNISGQPSGTTMKWRMKSLTNKNVIASGAILQWS